jgi:GNAT superfamily N-acetyltransferase
MKVAIELSDLLRVEDLEPFRKLTFSTKHSGMQMTIRNRLAFDHLPITVARMGPTIVGWALAIPELSPIVSSKSRMYTICVFVDSEFRGFGLGTRLLRKLKAALPQASLKCGFPVDSHGLNTFKQAAPLHLS